MVLKSPPSAPTAVNFKLSLSVDSNLQPFRVERVIGCDPLIQFLTPFPGGRYQVHEASYDPKSNQWFYVYGDDLRYPGEFGHWTGRGMNWNSICAECHNTRLKKNYDAATDSYHTTMAGMSVGCEACHGPLQKHLDWQQAHPKSTVPDPTVAKLVAARTVGHVRLVPFAQHGLDRGFPAGRFFLRSLCARKSLDYSQRWYPDGQIKDEDYEFSFLSRQQNVSGRRDLPGLPSRPIVTRPHSHGNDLCMRCHNGGYPKAPQD